MATVSAGACCHRPHRCGVVSKGQTDRGDHTAACETRRQRSRYAAACVWSVGGSSITACGGQCVCARAHMCVRPVRALQRSCFNARPPVCDIKSWFVWVCMCVRRLVGSGRVQSNTRHPFRLHTQTVPCSGCVLYTQHWCAYH